MNIEKEKILYNTYVSHAALNMDWLATAELLDDHEHTLESRLKFWEFNVQKQTYVLNSQIELPHEDGVQALEFSTPYSIENLLCATAGNLDVKLWALEDSDNIHSKKPFGERFASDELDLIGRYFQERENSGPASEERATRIFQLSRSPSPWTPRCSRSALATRCACTLRRICG